MLQDLRIGARVLVRERAFCALALVVLALGICGVTTMFSVVNAAVLRGFSFPNAERMMNIQFIDPSQTTFNGVNGQITVMDYEEMRPTQTSFERLAAYLNGSTVNVTVNGTPQRYTGVYTTPDFLQILGITPLMGRDFTAADNEPGAEKVALISHAIWQRDFSADPSIVGRVVRINGTAATIIGVMPVGFNFPTTEDLWLPLYSEFPPRPRNDPQNVNPGVIGLIKPGVSLDQANAEISTFARRFAEAYPDTNKAYHTGQVEPLINAYTPRLLRGVLWTMLGFCVGVLLIACVNVMNMQFARATLRSRELAIRSSIGATRARLVRQMLTESLLLAAMGTVIGVGLAYVAVDLLSSTLRNLDNPPPSWIVFDIDARVLAFTVGATFVAAVISGLLPAWMSSRANSVEVLREGGRSATSRSVMFATRALVVLQIVVTCVLLIGSLLQVQSILRQQRIDYGYDTSGLMSARMGLMDGDYPSPDTRRAFYDRVLRELGANPGFQSVALTNRFRMIFSGNGAIEIEGRTYREHRDRPQASFEQVTGGFFEVTGQRVLAGRTFTDEDLDARLPVAIVNAGFAAKHFGREHAIGRRFRTVDGSGTQFGRWRTIVGVVSDVRMRPPFNAPNVDDTGFYVPFYGTVFGPADEPFVSQFATVVVRPRGGQRADTLGPTLRREVNKIDPNLPLYFVDTPRRHLDSQVAQNRIIATMFSIFGLVAVVLASVGIYGVMSFAVNQRTQEFGVRMALGAGAGQILGMVLRQGAIQVAVGLLLGLGLAIPTVIVGGEAIQNALFGVRPFDPATFAGVAALIAAVALAATLVPARRATRVDPVIALRAE